jgi:hypothetical protein
MLDQHDLFEVKDVGNSEEGTVTLHATYRKEAVQRKITTLTMPAGSAWSLAAHNSLKVYVDID